MQEQFEENAIRPRALTLICILTFIGSGFLFFANGVVYLSIDSLRIAFDEGLFNAFELQLEEDDLKMFLSVDSSFFLFQSLLYSASLLGAYMMWKLRKQGFHIYAISQILVLIIYKVYLSSAPFPFFSMLLTITFILLYYRNLQFMR